eukprot:29666_1
MSLKRNKSTVSLYYLYTSTKRIRSLPIQRETATKLQVKQVNHIPLPGASKDQRHRLRVQSNNKSTQQPSILSPRTLTPPSQACAVPNFSEDPITIGDRKQSKTKKKNQKPQHITILVTKRKREIIQEE